MFRNRPDESSLEQGEAEKPEPSRRLTIVAIFWSVIFPPLGPDYYRAKKSVVLLTLLNLAVALYVTIEMERWGVSEETYLQLATLNSNFVYAFATLQVVLSIALTLLARERYTPVTLGKMPRRIFRKAVIAIAIFSSFMLPLLTSIGEDRLPNFYNITTQRVFGASMMPTLVEGDRLLKHDEVKTYRKARIYFFQQGDEILVKRLVGFGGDRIKVENGRITRNGKKFQYVPLDEPIDFAGLRLFPTDEGKYYFEIDNFGNKHLVWLLNDDSKTGLDAPTRGVVEFEISDGELFFIGDNRYQSHDSRAFGLVLEQNVIAEAMVIVWHFSSKFGFLSKRVHVTLTPTKHDE